MTKPVMAGLVAIAGMLALIIAGGFYPALDLFERLEGISYDWRVRQSFAAEAPIANDLALVYIDDDSLLELNQREAVVWPWPRQVYGRALKALREQGAKATGFDIVFAELHPGTARTDMQVVGRGTLSSDEYLAWELAQSTNAALAMMGEVLNGQWHPLPPAGLFATNAAALVHISRETEPDGVLRRVRLYRDTPEGKRVWHLALWLAAKGIGADLNQAEVKPEVIRLQGSQGVKEIPVDAQGRMWIDWSLHWNDARLTAMNITKLLTEAKDGSLQLSTSNSPMAGKLVIIGSTGSANNIADLGTTPLDRDTYLVSSHWNVLNGILTERFVTRPGRMVTLLLLLTGGLLMLAASVRWPVGKSSVGMILSAGVYGLICFMAFQDGRIWLPLLAPIAAIAVTHVAVVATRASVEQAERRRVQGMFSKLVSAEVVDQLLQSKELTMGGEVRRITILFADIRGFTAMNNAMYSLAEGHVYQYNLNPAEARAYLNEQAAEVLQTVNLYITTVADAVKQHGGTLDKYIGDCVMAFWGAPIDNERHAVNAVRAAVDAQRALTKLNDR
ncbi:MAG: CHASE2 domain-containing protein, partial [Verrucomicrobiota bacterium]